MRNAYVPPPESEITPEDWEPTPERVRGGIAVLSEEVKQHKDAVEKLQEIVNRNSGNSSQPPSQDRPDQIPSKETPSHSRQRGGQPGHRGLQRLLVEHVDEVVHHRPISCRGCGALGLGEDPKPYRHQVTELPPEVAPSQFGLNVISLVALTMGRYRLSKRQVAQFLGECFDIKTPASTVVNHQKTISQALAEPVAELRPYVQQQPVCNVDETGGRQAGQPKRSWLWTVVTRYAPLFRIAPSCSSEIARDLLGEHDAGGRGRIVAAPTPGWLSASSAGDVGYATSRKSSNGAAIRIASDGT